MTVLNNLRISQRRRVARHGPKPRTFLTQLRIRSDGQIVLELAGNAPKYLGKGVGGRIWFCVADLTLYITDTPWGPFLGKRDSTRIRKTTPSQRRIKSSVVDVAPKFKRRSSREPTADVADGGPG